MLSDDIGDVINNFKLTDSSKTLITTIRGCVFIQKQFVDLVEAVSNITNEYIYQNLTALTEALYPSITSIDNTLSTFKENNTNSKFYE